MKVASYLVDGNASYGIVVENRIVDIPALLGASAPRDVVALIGAGDEGLRKVREALAKPGEARLDRAQVTFLPPVVNPPKFFCIGRNYAEHAKEAGFEMSPIPIMFHRFSSTLIGDGADILYPKVSTQLDWEGELAVVIGKGHKGQIAMKDAMDHVFGYTAFNDVTVRDYQFRTTQYIAGKNFRTSGPLGPVVVTKDELINPHDLQIIVRVNGTEMQRDRTSSMHFDIPFIVNHLSEFIDLQAGDVIAMGTPAGVGFKRKPPIFLKQGDVVEVELEGVGTLTNTVVDDR